MPQSGSLVIDTPFAVRMDRDGILQLDRLELAQRLAGLAPHAPVVAMIHGYRFAPDAGQHCPFGHIFALEPSAALHKRRDKTLVSWPRHLGLGGKAGLAIGFGWPARGWIGDVNKRALAAGAGLAQLAFAIADIDPARQLDVIGHSLGVRAALAALHHARPGHLRRLILLAGAEVRGPALRAMRSPAGQAAQIVNVTTRENDVFDFIYEWGVAGGRDTAIGQGLGLGLGCALPNWFDLQLDTPGNLDALEQLGYPLPSPPARICHWSPYIRPGIFTLYRAILDGQLRLSDLPAAKSRRWSGLIALGRAPA